jgi:uncharacterized protein RhaS with RHS repeats
MSLDTCEFETEFQRLVGRYYDPATDQFMSVDPLVGITGQPYAFTADDPTNETDPLGMIIPGGPGGCPGPNAACSQKTGPPSSAAPPPGTVCAAVDPSYCSLLQQAVRDGDTTEVECLKAEILCTAEKSVSPPDLLQQATNLVSRGYNDVVGAVDSIPYANDVNNDVSSALNFASKHASRSFSLSGNTVGNVLQSLRGAVYQVSYYVQQFLQAIANLADSGEPLPPL